MKTYTIVFLLAMILGSLATKTASFQPTFNPVMTTKDKLLTSNLGSALLHMVQVGNTVEADFDDLYEALELLKEDLLNKKDAEVADFNDDGEAHKLAASRLNRLIDDYESQIIQYNDELKALKDEAITLNDSLGRLNQQIASAKAKVAEEEAQIKKLNDDLQVTISDYNEAITLLDKAMEKLNEAQNGSDASSFIQTSNESFKILAQNIGTSLKKVNAKATQIKPLQTFFTQLLTSEPSSATIGRAVEALQNLKASFQQGIATAEEQTNTAIDKRSKQRQQYIIQIGNLTTQVETINGQLESNQEAQFIRQTSLSEAERNSRLETANLEEENNTWDERKQLHQQLMPQYDNDYKIVEQAEQVLRQSA